jgi:Alpha/beta hydrolase domain
MAISNHTAQPNGGATISGPLEETPIDGVLVWDVAGLDYIAEEYFLAGRADVLEPVSMADAVDMRTRDNTADLTKREFKLEIVANQQPYTTRLVVYRPRVKSRCSGRVVVEPFHPAGGGSNIMWSALHTFFAARGDIYVGVQLPTTIAGLKAANPNRYGTLHASDPTQLWGMLSDCGRILKDQANGPLQGCQVKRLLMTGFSFTGVATTNFANYHHQTAKLPNGNNVFDAYLPVGEAAYVRPLDVPVMRLNTQSDFSAFGGLSNRRIDDAAYRHYEVPGAPHVFAPPPMSAARAPVPIAAPVGLPDLSPEACWASFPKGSRFNDFPLDLVLAAAFQNMYEWLERGIAPPPSSLIESDSSGAAKLDEYGNARGGVRYPLVSVPIATYGVGSTPACFLFGYTAPFDAERCRGLYGDRVGYVKRVRSDVEQLVARKLLLDDGAIRLLALAESVSPF